MPMAPACKKKPPEELNSSGGSVIEDPFIPFYRKQYKHTGDKTKCIKEEQRQKDR